MILTKCNVFMNISFVRFIHFRENKHTVFQKCSLLLKVSVLCPYLFLLFKSVLVILFIVIFCIMQKSIVDIVTLLSSK